MLLIGTERAEKRSAKVKGLQANILGSGGHIQITDGKDLFDFMAKAESISVSHELFTFVFKYFFLVQFWHLRVLILRYLQSKFAVSAVVFSSLGVHDLQSLMTTDPRHLHEKLGGALASKMVSAHTTHTHTHTHTHTRTTPDNNRAHAHTSHTHIHAPIYLNAYAAKCRHVSHVAVSPLLHAM